MGIGDVVVTQFKGDASIDHVFTTAHGAADAEHDIFSRTIESPEGNGVAAAVVAVAASKNHGHLDRSRWGGERQGRPHWHRHG